MLLKTPFGTSVVQLIVANLRIEIDLGILFSNTLFFRFLQKKKRKKQQKDNGILKIIYCKCKIFHENLNKNKEPQNPNCLTYFLGQAKKINSTTNYSTTSFGRAWVYTFHHFWYSLSGFSRLHTQNAYTFWQKKKTQKSKTLRKPTCFENIYFLKSTFSFNLVDTNGYLETQFQKQTDDRLINVIPTWKTESRI